VFSFTAHCLLPTAFRSSAPLRPRTPAPLRSAFCLFPQSAPLSPCFFVVPPLLDFRARHR